MRAAWEMSEQGRPRAPTLGWVRALPNLLTAARVLAIPVVLAVMYFDTRANAFWGAMLFAVASVTDAVDGYLARRLRVESALGKFFDPLADKLLVMGVLLMLLQMGRVSVWVALVLLGREVTINSLRSVAAEKGLVIAARDLGKFKTAFQMVGLWALMVHYPYALEPLRRPVDFHRIGTYILYISVFFSLASAVDYAVGFVGHLRAQRSDR